MILSHKSLTRVSAAVAAVLAGTPTAMAAPATPAPAVVAPAPALALKHLPAGQEQLTFRGELSHRTFSVYLGRGEVERAKVFQLALKNAVALLPERSTLKLSVNGRALATLPARSSEGLSITSVAIPPGVLVPGFNTVEVSVAMAHRVDCSVAATYELWTLLDPAQTGFVVPTAPWGGSRSISDIAAEALAADGTTRIALRIPDSGDAGAIERASLFIDALVQRAGLVRPIVETDEGGGRGAGFDVVIASAGTRDEATRNLRILGREDGVTLARDANTDRLVVALSGTDDADLDRQIAAFAASGAGLPPPSPAGEMIVAGEERRSFASLGLLTESFSGRRFASALDVVLPSDFYPANYDKAQVLIDGSYAASLDPGSDLVFRVNGALVSSLRLGPDRGGLLDHETVDLPLRFFHPGRNEVAIEAITSTAADRQCDITAMANDVRFTLAKTSEIVFPSFAHLGTIPQIPGAMAGGRRGDGTAVDLYLPGTGAASVGPALTVMANRAAEHRGLERIAVHLGAPAADAAPGIVVSSFDELPADLRGEVRAETANAAEPASKVETNGAGQDDQSTAGQGVVRAAGSGDLRHWAGEAQRLLRQQGFFFGADRDARTVPVSARSLVVTALAPRPQDAGAGGISLPRFAASSAQWLVVTAADAPTLRDGLTRLVSDGRWGDLDGQAVSLDLADGRMASIQPSRVLYVAPDHLVLSDVRPILGGLVSNHIELSVAFLMLLMAILGLSTHALIRRSGAK